MFVVAKEEEECFAKEEEECFAKEEEECFAKEEAEGMFCKKEEYWQEEGGISAKGE